MTVTTTSPLRVDLAGGVTDIPLFASKIGTDLLNIGVDVYKDPDHREKVAVSITVQPSRLASDTLLINKTKTPIGSSEYGLVSRLAGLYLDKIHSAAPLDVRVENTLPKGTGLGSSASISLCMLAAISKQANKSVDLAELIRLAHHAETIEIGVSGGFQDFIACAYGQVNHITFTSTAILSDQREQQRMTSPLPEELANYLDQNMIIVVKNANNIGSDLVVNDQIRNFNNNPMRLTSELLTIKEANADLADFINHSSNVNHWNWQEFGEIIDKSWQAQKKLSPYVGESLHDLEEDLRPHTLAMRGPGAASNSLIIFAKEGERSNLVDMLHKYRDRIEVYYPKCNYSGISIS